MPKKVVADGCNDPSTGFQTTVARDATRRRHPSRLISRRVRGTSSSEGPPGNAHHVPSRTRRTRGRVPHPLGARITVGSGAGSSRRPVAISDSRFGGPGRPRAQSGSRRDSEGWRSRTATPAAPSSDRREMPALLRPQGRGSRPRSAVVPNRAAALRSCTQAWRTSTSRPRRGDLPPGRCRSRASGGRRYARNRARRYPARTLRTPARPRSNPTPTRKLADVGVLDAADASDAGAAGRAGGRVARAICRAIALTANAGVGAG